MSPTALPTFSFSISLSRRLSGGGVRLKMYKCLNVPPSCFKFRENLHFQRDVSCDHLQSTLSNTVLPGVTISYWTQQVTALSNPLVY